MELDQEFFLTQKLSLKGLMEFHKTFFLLQSLRKKVRWNSILHFFNSKNTLLFIDYQQKK